jgi:hypothetical protein
MHTRVRRALLGICIATALAWIGWSMLTRYTPRGRYGAYLEPTRAVLRAGLALDSGALVRMNVAAPAMRWALNTGRTDPELLRALVAGLSSDGGMRNRDRIAMSFVVKGLKRCDGWYLTAFYSGAPTTMRLEDITTHCNAP